MQVVCQFFLRGTCKFGNQCRNEHPQNAQGDRRSAFGGEPSIAFALLLSSLPIGSTWASTSVPKTIPYRHGTSSLLSYLIG
jgi:hypothetical protein